MNSEPLFGVIVRRIADGVELCLAPGVKLPDGRAFPSQLVSEIAHQYASAPQFAVADTREYEGMMYSFYVITDDTLGFVLLTGSSVSRARGHRVLQEVSTLFYRMFVENPKNLSPTTTVNFVRPAHDLLLRLSVSSLGADSDPQQQSLQKVKREIEEVKSIAIDNVNSAVQRGTKLDEIMEATDDLQFQAQGFHQNSRQVYNQIWWESMKGRLIVGGVACAFLLLILFTFFY